jgi:iron complex transport system substrate-binding protein
MNQLAFGLMVLACTMLVIMPAVADDYTLGIFGNANMDDTIDEEDIAYVEGIIEGTNEETELADANYDGRIDKDDIAQIELIIQGDEKELTLIDSSGKVVTVGKPVERIIVEYMDTAEIVQILGEADKVVGVTNCITENPKQFPELSKRSFVGIVMPGDPDYEAIISLNPDIYLTFTSDRAVQQREHLPGITVLYLGLYYPELSNAEGSTFADGVRKLGYILDRKAEAEQYIKWRNDLIDTIKSRTDGLLEDEKPRVLMTSRIQPESLEFRTYPDGDKLSLMCTVAGGKSIAENLPEYTMPLEYRITVDPEWVIEQDPEFIFVHDARTPYGYDMDDPERMKETRDIFMNHPILAEVAAVKSGNVYVLNGVFRNDASGSILGAVYMSKILHPELFEDLNPQAIHQEYLTRFQGLDYDLDEHGVFVYPPLEVS